MGRPCLVSPARLARARGVIGARGRTFTPNAFQDAQQKPAVDSTGDSGFEHRVYKRSPALARGNVPLRASNGLIHATRAEDRTTAELSTRWRILRSATVDRAGHPKPMLMRSLSLGLVSLNTNDA